LIRDHRLEYLETNFTLSSPGVFRSVTSRTGNSGKFGRNRGGVWNKLLLAYISSNISETDHDYYRAPIHMRLRLVPKSMTLDDLEGSLCTLFQNTCLQSKNHWVYEKHAASRGFLTTARLLSNFQHHDQNSAVNSVCKV